VRVTTSRAKFAGLALIAALCAGFTLGLTAPAWGHEDKLAHPNQLDEHLREVFLDKSYERGEAAFVRGDYETALREWRPLAEQGYAYVQYALGLMYGKGRGVSQDYAEAANWLRKAAEQGYASAQFSLGLMYENGEGVTQDYARAVGWWRKAAEQGYAQAQYSLGVMYGKGQGIPQDYAKAVKWYRKAAEQGYAQAQYNLGLAYGLGQGVPQDLAQAHMWLNLAASRFPYGVKRDISVKSRDDVAKVMTPAQIAEAEKLAREWRLK